MADPTLDVSGGAGGTHARFEDIDLLADHSDQLGRDLAAVAAECQRYLIHPDVVASGLLHPAGALRFKTSLFSALNGTSGLTALAVELGLHAVTLRANATSYRVVEQAQAELLDAARWGAGFTLGALLSIPAVGVPLLGAGASVAGAGQARGVDWQGLLTDHPGVVETAMGVAPGLISGLPGPVLATDVASGARLLGLLYPDGVARVTDHGPDTHAAVSRPPAGLADLLIGLEHRNDQAQGDQQGEIGVRQLVHPDGTTSYIVDMPGTKDWNPVPLRQYESLNDLGTNLRALGGEETAYQQGVVEALRRAGATPGDPVMLVGHSQGGIVAAQTAAALAGSGELNVTHVVTAGSPVGRVELPDQVQMLSMENNHDIVARLDATGNPDRTNWVTASFDTQHGTVGENHSISTSYLPAASALDASQDPSVVAYREGAAMFLAAPDASVTTYRYQVERSFPE